MQEIQTLQSTGSPGADPHWVCTLHNPSSVSARTPFVLPSLGDWT